MSETTNITIRIDKDIKQEADILFAELGLTFNTAINVFLSQSIREGRIPFMISLNQHDNDNVKED